MGVVPSDEQVRWSRFPDKLDCEVAALGLHVAWAALCSALQLHDLVIYTAFTYYCQFASEFIH